MRKTGDVNFWFLSWNMSGETRRRLARHRSVFPCRLQAQLSIQRFTQTNAFNPLMKLLGDSLALDDQRGHQTGEAVSQRCKGQNEVPLPAQHVTQTEHDNRSYQDL